MTADNVTLSVGLIVLLIGVIVNVYGFFASRKKDIKTDTREVYDIRENLVKLDLKTTQIFNSTSEIKNDVKQISSRIGSVEKDVASLDQKVKTAFEQIKELREEVKNRE